MPRWRIIWAAIANEEAAVSETGPDNLYAEHLATLMRRTDRALAATGFDALVVYAGRPPVLFLDDQDYPFKVNPQFKVWVPVVDNPRSILVYRPGVRPTLLFYRPNDFWHQPADLPTAAWTVSVDVVPMQDDANADIHWSQLGRVAVLGPEDQVACAERACVNPKALLALLDFERAVKTPYELACLRKASEMGARGHAAALSTFQRGGAEYDAQMSYLQACRQREEEMPYNNIVAYNEHAAVLHYQHLDRQVAPLPASFLTGAGPRNPWYGAGITR